MATKNILSINAGSSSIKMSLFAAGNDQVQRVGQPQKEDLTNSDPDAAIQRLIDWLKTQTAEHEIVAIGHRIVHGGPNNSKSRVITPELEKDLESLAQYDPDHAPMTLRLVRAVRQNFPDIPQIACFDTAFFHDLPHIAQLTSLPRKYESLGLRRYGFHGLSYTFLLKKLAEMNGGKTGKVIFAHLGSGSSLAATIDGKPIDTTMAFTPASGVIMSTRAGDLDPGIAWFLHKQTGMTLEQYNHMINFESGLLGVSDLTADMHKLIQDSPANPKAADAVNLYCYQIKKTIGAYAAVMGGLDALVFSGGIGEQAPLIRSQICEGLQFLGINLDNQANSSHAPIISTADSGVAAHIIPTDEEQVITEEVLQIINTS